jgi:hypothetical protein
MPLIDSGLRPAVLLVLSLILGLTVPAGGQCPGDDDCYVTHASPGCNSAECCEQVCAYVPTCCEVEWDENCVEAALAICECGNPNAGDCFDPYGTGTPGCNDLACCEAMCAIDSFCCDNQWDELCALQAPVVCLACGDPSAGDCLKPNGTPGCFVGSCCQAVCAVDPLCCDAGWDEKCASQAAAICCIGDLDGNGAVDVEDLLDVILLWGPCVGFPFPCGADLNGDGEVGVDDLLFVILGWGPCDPV